MSPSEAVGRQRLDGTQQSGIGMYPWILTNSPEARQMHLVSLVVRCGWCIGYIIVLICVFRLTYSHGMRQSPFFARFMLPHFARYGDRYCWWTMIVLARRALVVAIKIFGYSVLKVDVGSRLVLIVMVLLFSLMLNL